MRLQEILRQSDCLSNVTIDQILFESSYPILCSGYDNNNIYLIICHSVNSERMSWIVTKTTYDIIISMLNNNITIRDAFLGFTSEKILLTLEKEGMHTIKCDVTEINENILPTPGQYMDAEEEEFDEEIEYYEEMKVKMIKLIYVCECDICGVIENAKAVTWRNETEYELPDNWVRGNNKKVCICPACSAKLNGSETTPTYISTVEAVPVYGCPSTITLRTDGITVDSGLYKVSFAPTKDVSSES